MWTYLASRILRNRTGILVVLGLATVMMGIIGAKKVELSRDFPQLLPETDSTLIEFLDFQKTFGNDDEIMVIGSKGTEIYELKNFLAWYQLGQDLRKLEIEGEIREAGESRMVKEMLIDSLFSIAHLYNVVKNDSAKSLEFKLLIQRLPATQEELDSIIEVVHSLPFYKKILFNDSTHAHLMVLDFNDDIFNSNLREDMVALIQQRVWQFTEETGIEVHISGLPYIRTIMSKGVKKELKMFIGLALFVTGALLFLFFRSWRVVLFSLLVVVVGVIWSFGIIGLFNYKLSILLGMIPPVIIVIGIPNCIFLLNKYHQEFKNHGNQIKALTRVIEKIGNATFLTNATTAMGFATFIFTNSTILQEFGVIAAINIMSVFMLALLLIPIFFSFQAVPKEKHIRHLDKKWLYFTVNKLVHLVTNKRKWIYIVSIASLLLAIYGISLIKITGNIVDDLPRDQRVYQDMQFIEDHFNGIMPFEIMIYSDKSGQVTKASTLRKLEKLQEVLAKQPELSRSLSIADAVKFAKQAFYNGNEKKYALIKGNESSFIAPYLQQSKDAQDVVDLNGFVDSLKQRTRITLHIADINTNELEALFARLRPQIEEIFSPEEYKVTLTGASVIYLKGTNYLVNNLFMSLGIAIVFIAFIMSFLFRSLRMVLVSMVPNLIPLVLTAAFMGFFDITIKPSTILVFSIAFGISVDDTIHFLAKYRQELKLRRWNRRLCVLNALAETGISMIYTSVVLFFGFAIFIASDFGGTIAMGVLVSTALLVAMLANLLLLPSILLSLEKYLTTKAFEKEPYVELLDEEVDIELEYLIVQKDESARAEQSK